MRERYCKRYGELHEQYPLETALSLRNGPFKSIEAIKTIIESGLFTKFKESEIEIRSKEWGNIKGVSGNTFRVFRCNSETEKNPSTKYRDLWTSSENIDYLNEILRTTDSEKRLEIKLKLARVIKEVIHYKPNGQEGRESQIPVYLKLLDLSLKSLAIQRGQNFENLDVPLDRYSLQPLSSKINNLDKEVKKCWFGSGPYSMGYVRKVEGYQWLQKQISDNFEPFEYDMAAWNLAHLDQKQS